MREESYESNRPLGGLVVQFRPLGRLFGRFLWHLPPLRCMEVGLRGQSVRKRMGRDVQGDEEEAESLSIVNAAFFALA